MKRYLSFGGGVNSTALLLLLKDDGIDFETVYVDHQTDYPETREYIKMLNELRRGIISIYPSKEGFSSLYQYCLYRRFMPNRMLRWCTDGFKVQPFRSYIQRPCVVYLGIDYGEQRRAKPVDIDGMVYEYPLVAWGIDRKGCEKIISDAGLPLPEKSGCFICPFQRSSQWLHLRREHPDLWCKAKKLEAAVNERLKEKGGEPMYLAGIPLDRAVKEEQPDLFGWKKPCNCGI